MTMTDRDRRTGASEFGQQSSMRVALGLLARKWTPVILWHLKDAPLRFGQLRTVVPDVTPQVLTQSLRAMERDGLIRRVDHEEQPPHVEYHLTELGRSLCGPTEAVRDWADRNVAAVLAARHQYRAGHRLGQEPAPPTP